MAEVWGYKQDDIVMLTDDAQNPRQIPTRDNIVGSFELQDRTCSDIVDVHLDTSDAVARSWRSAKRLSVLPL